MSKDLATQLMLARKAHRLTQEALASRAGVSRMTVQRLEAGAIDPRLSSVMELARAMGMELMLVPAALSQEVESFLRSGGRLLSLPAGTDAPPSIIDVLTSNAIGAQPAARVHRLEKKS